MLTNFGLKAAVKKSIAIETALKKMGWKTIVNFSNKSNSFYIEISKTCESGYWTTNFQGNPVFLNDEVCKKIRFSDHDLPVSYRYDSDYYCRFDLDRHAWSNLKPVLKQLYKDTV